jgi:hypothetical protein
MWKRLQANDEIRHCQRAFWLTSMGVWPRQKLPIGKKFKSVFNGAEFFMNDVKE